MSVRNIVSHLITSKLRVIAVLCLIWWVSFGFLYLHHDQVTKEQTKSVVLERASLVRQYLDVTLSFVDFMRRQMEINIQLADQGLLKHPQSSQLINYPDYGVWALDGTADDSSLRPISKGAITGLGNIEKLSTSARNEVNAALSLEYDIGNELTNDLEFIWAYYTSQHGFMLLAPKVSVQDFHFTEHLYTKPFWVPAIPQNNPQRKTVISDLYDDAAGQGFMISISAPVYSGDLFKGVVSLDIGLQKLLEGLQVGETAGESFLIDEKWTLIATQHQFAIGEDIYGEGSLPNTIQYTEHAKFKDFRIPILKGQIYLIHRITTLDRIYQILKSMLFHISLVSFALIGAYLMVSLMGVLKKVEEMATHDSLTNLLNRRAMEAQAKELFDASHACISTLILDIDKFKRVNDSYGHDIGDIAIKHVAEVLRSHTRNSDLVGRIGGEEFLIVLPETSDETALTIAERIRQSVENSTFSGLKLKITISLGCAQRLDQESYESLVKRSDVALYKAKENGRNRVEGCVKPD